MIIGNSPLTQLDGAVVYIRKYCLNLSLYSVLFLDNVCTAEFKRMAPKQLLLLNIRSKYGAMRVFRTLVKSGFYRNHAMEIHRKLNSETGVSVKGHQVQ